MTLLKDKLKVHNREHNMALENLNANKADFENLKILRPLLEQQYIYYQEMKAFIRDFVDCYNEKVAFFFSINQMNDFKIGKLYSILI